MTNLSLSDDFDDFSDPLGTTMKDETDEKEKKTDTKKDSEQSKKSNSFSSSFDDFDTKSTINTEKPKNETEKKEKSSEKVDLSFESFETESKKSEITEKSKMDTLKSNKSNFKTTESEISIIKTDKSENKTQKTDETPIKDDKKSTQNSTIKSKQEKKVENKKEIQTPQNKNESFENVEIKPTDDELNYVPPKIRPIAPLSKPAPKEDPQDEINRLKELVMQQRHIIDSQKETIKLLMKEQINYEEMSKLRSALASKDPLLQLVAATPLSESRAMSDLRAENASLRREIDEIETRHLSEMKALRSQFAQMSARQMPQDGCAVCRRRIRELENQLKEKQ